LKYDNLDKLRNEVDLNGRSAIHYACVKGNQKILQILLDFPSKKHENQIVSYLNLQDSNGNTPLHLSLFHKHLQISIYLLSLVENQFQFNPTLLNVNGKTILDIACEFQNDDSFNFIEQLLKFLEKYPTTTTNNSETKKLIETPISGIFSRRNQYGNPDVRGAKPRISLNNVRNYCLQKQTKSISEFIPINIASPLHLCCVSKSWKSFQSISNSKLFSLSHKDNLRFGKRYVLELACLNRIPIEIFKNSLEILLKENSIQQKDLEECLISLISTLSNDSSNIEYLQSILDQTSNSIFKVKKKKKTKHNNNCCSLINLFMFPSFFFFFLFFF